MTEPRIWAYYIPMAHLPMGHWHIDIERLRAENERLRVALRHVLTGVNHVALYKQDNWPPPGTDHQAALAGMGAGQNYDLWCCWNAAMQARAALEGK